MKTVIQRVSHASVKVNDRVIGAIESGILALIGVEKADNEQTADKLLERIINYRIFEDDNGQMNLSLLDTKAGLLLVPQFTIVADTKKGKRPSFSSAATPEQANQLFEYLLARAKSLLSPVASGEFGAEMHIDLCNHGPVTFILEVRST